MPDDDLDNARQMDDFRDAAEQTDPHEPLVRELEALRVRPDECLVIRVDPSVELEAKGFHEALGQVIVDAGLAGRCMVVSLPITKVEFAVVENDVGIRGVIEGA